MVGSIGLIIGIHFFLKHKYEYSLGSQRCCAKSGTTIYRLSSYRSTTSFKKYVGEGGGSSGDHIYIYSKYIYIHTERVIGICI